MRIEEAIPFPYEFEIRNTALVLIDMQRDFIEPGGFGETLGNDVSLLEAIVPATKTALQAWREARSDRGTRTAGGGTRGRTAARSRAKRQRR